MNQKEPAPQIEPEDILPGGRLPLELAKLFKERRPKSPEEAAAIVKEFIVDLFGEPV